MSTLWERIMNTNPLAYWPMNEQWGNNALDATGNSFTGTYTSININQTGIGDGTPSVQFTGTASKISIVSTGFKKSFNGREGSILMWIKPYSMSFWSDGNSGFLLDFVQTLFFNEILITKTGVAATPINCQYYANGTNTTIVVSGSSFTQFDSFSTIGMTWSYLANQFKVYIGGVLVGNKTSLGAWGNGSLTDALIGTWAIGSIPYKGWMAHTAIWTRPLSPVEMLNLSHVTITDPVRNYNTGVHYIDYDKRGLGFLYGAMKAKGKV